MLGEARNHDAVVLMQDGKKQPLFAVYRKSLVPQIEELSGKASARSLP
ncbi:hypothetical protein PDESU_05957 [Pontiella desulfatans]|uniref:Uncharacterized protein n=1 Tax=Pontiella desulfatans TaxID=2750659 RepID=A0A6C2UD67_PONDE|nr:hypothetical protein PDESU_05957 [Pontiella desulfatans]